MSCFMISCGFMISTIFDLIVLCGHDSVFMISAISKLRYCMVSGFYVFDPKCNERRFLV